MSTQAPTPVGEEPKIKAQYWVTNWREYDRALVERGSDRVARRGVPAGTLAARGERQAVGAVPVSDLATQILLMMKRGVPPAVPGRSAWVRDDPLVGPGSAAGGWTQ